MPALIAEDVVRCTLNGVYNGRPVANILDLVINGADADIDRGAAIHDRVDALIDAWADNIMIHLSNEYSFTSVSYVDLSFSDGEVGERGSTGDTTLPHSGSDTGQSYAGNVAILVKKLTAASRGSRNGRFYLPGITEAQMDGNALSPSYVNDLQTGFDTFLETMTTTGVLDTFNCFPTVVHTRNTGTVENPIITYDSNTQISTFQPQRLVATQRRRVRP